MQKLKLHNLNKSLFVGALLSLSIFFKINTATAQPLNSSIDNNTAVVSQKYDDEYSNLLVGIWKHTVVKPGAGEVMLGEVTYFDNGTFTYNAQFAGQVLFTYSGSWAINNGFIYETVEVTTAKFIPVGAVDVKKLVSMGEGGVVMSNKRGMASKLVK